MIGPFLAWLLTPSKIGVNHPGRSCVLATYAIHPPSMESFGIYSRDPDKGRLSRALNKAHNRAPTTSAHQPQVPNILKEEPRGTHELSYTFQATPLARMLGDLLLMFANGGSRSLQSYYPGFYSTLQMYSVIAPTQPILPIPEDGLCQQG